ncbi:surface lipoprotein assembly modifier, partial [Thauera linaloolentis]
AFDGFLGARRHDRQQVYIVSLGANGWKIAGLVPELRVRHSRNRSNLDWAFGFRQTEASIMLRHSF